MTPDDFAQLVLKRTEVRRPPFPIRLAVWVVSSRSPGPAAYEVGAVVFYVITKVRDRTSGEPLAITFEYVIGSLELGHWDEARAIAFIRHRLHDVAMHEMDEALFLDGVRAFDPHATRAFFDLIIADGKQP